MPEGIKKLFEKLKGYWNDLGKSQKIRIFVMAGIVVAAVVLTLALTLRVEYVPLFDT
ncbi:MAG TPA: flagellar M-ring protein FliF, partial [Clostridiaceae bacterium]|nr:flagellar M-ring protein FliF [Clostridiaceae bacterium]